MTEAALRLLENGEFSVRTREDAVELAELLAAGLFPDPLQDAMCLAELLINSVEHGNLEIDGPEKCALLRAGTYERELADRYARFSERRVRVAVRRVGERTEVEIADEGAGFDWQMHMARELRPSLEPRGRGIALARARFPELEYRGAGNVVAFRTGGKR